MTDEQVRDLATRLARQTSAWNMYSETTRTEIVDRWVDWLNVNLPAKDLW